MANLIKYIGNYRGGQQGCHGAVYSRKGLSPTIPAVIYKGEKMDVVRKHGNSKGCDRSDRPGKP